jgi:hypothetical protein
MQIKNKKPNLFPKELILCLKRDFILKQQQQQPKKITVFITDIQFSSQALCGKGK